MNVPVSARFAVGDRVVYPGHGVGVVERIISEDLYGAVCKLWVVKCGEVEFKINQTGSGSHKLRPVSEKAVLSDIVAILNAAPARTKGRNWTDRSKKLMERVNSPDILEIARVVRDISPATTVSSAERRIFDLALGLLTEEMAVMIDPAEPERAKAFAFLNKKCSRVFIDPASKFQQLRKETYQPKVTPDPFDPARHKADKPPPIPSLMEENIKQARAAQAVLPPTSRADTGQLRIRQSKAAPRRVAAKSPAAVLAPSGPPPTIDTDKSRLALVEKDKLIKQLTARNDGQQKQIDGLEQKLQASETSQKIRLVEVDRLRSDLQQARIELERSVKLAKDQEPSLVLEALPQDEQLEIEALKSSLKEWRQKCAVARRTAGQLKSINLTLKRRLKEVQKQAAGQEKRLLESRKRILDRIESVRQELLVRIDSETANFESLLAALKQLKEENQQLREGSPGQS